MLDKYRQFWAKPAAAALLARRGSHGMEAYYQPDDHEWGGDNWDHSVTQANDATGIGAANQAEVNLHWKRGNDAHIEFLAETWDNPTPAAGNTERPSDALTGGENPPAADYPIKYFYVDKTVLGGGLVRIIFVDCLSYRSPTAATDNASKVMLGSQQEAWLLARIAECASYQHVIVSSTKLLYNTQTTFNGDTFGLYTTERQRMLAAIQATGVSVIWLSGDRHTMHVTDTRVSRGGVVDIIDICACPAGVLVNGVGRTFASPGTRLEFVGGKQGFGVLTFSAGGLTAELRSAFSSSVFWSASFAAGSNAPIYAAAPAIRRLT